MKKLLTLFMCFALVGLYSCGSDDDDQGGVATDPVYVFIPVKMTSPANNEVYSFEYNKKNRLVSYKVITPSSSSEVKIEYNASGQLVKSTRTTPTVSDASNFTHKGNVITYGKSGTMNVNDKGYAVSSAKEQYNYDVDGRLISTDYNLYKYDDKNGIYKDVDVPQWFLIDFLGARFAENYISNVTEDKYFEGDHSSFDHNAYTYNEYNYPSQVKSTASYESGETIIYIEYQKVQIN